MTGEPLIIRPEDLDPSASVDGAMLSIANWPAGGTATEVAPLHVHHEDDEAWYVIEGAMRFRLADREVVAAAGTTVLIPAGVAHTFGNAGPEPSRYLIIMPVRLRELIAELHRVDRSQHASVYEEFASTLLEQSGG